MELVFAIAPYVAAFIVCNCRNHARTLARILIASRYDVDFRTQYLAQVIAAIHHAARRYHKRDGRIIPLFSALNLSDNKFPIDDAIKKRRAPTNALMMKCATYCAGYHNIVLRGICDFNQQMAYILGAINGNHGELVSHICRNPELISVFHHRALNETFGRVIEKTAIKWANFETILVSFIGSIDPSLWSAGFPTRESGDYGAHSSNAEPPLDTIRVHYAHGLIKKKCATRLQPLLRDFDRDTRIDLCERALMYGSEEICALFTDGELAATAGLIFGPWFSRNICNLAYLCDRLPVIAARVRGSLKYALESGHLFDHDAMITYCANNAQIIAHLRAMSAEQIHAIRISAQNQFSYTTNPRILARSNANWRKLFPETGALFDPP